MIISASRRTDIPAFYSDWLMNRVRAGFVMTRNPFNAQQVKHVSLLPEDVDVLVFWTRNPAKLLPHMDELNERGFRSYFNFTLTGYPRALERKTPHPAKAIELFQQLAERVGPEKVIWRYDPILLCNLLPLEEHLRLFSKIAAGLEGSTQRVVISLSDFYAKTQRNLNAIEGLVYEDLKEKPDQALQLACQMKDIAHQYGMGIQACAEEFDLTPAGIQPGKCIDDALIHKLFDIRLSPKKDTGQRAACGCIKSVDIGQYNSCLHGCQYCYATYNDKQVRRNHARHDVDSAFLIGNEEI